MSKKEITVGDAKVDSSQGVLIGVVARDIQQTFGLSADEVEHLLNTCISGEMKTLATEVFEDFLYNKLMPMLTDALDQNKALHNGEDLVDKVIEETKLDRERLAAEFLAQLKDIKDGIKQVQEIQVKESQDKAEQYDRRIEALNKAINEKFISRKKIGKRIDSLKEVGCFEFRVEFYDIVASNDIQELNSFLDSIDVVDKRDYLIEIIRFMLRIFDIKNHSPLAHLIQRARDKGAISGGEYFELQKQLEEEVKKIDDGFYELDVERDVFIAYAQEDIEEVKRLVSFLEKDGEIDCFYALRNLRQSRGDDYWEALCVAMAHCKGVVFISTPDSRNMKCQAVGSFGGHQGELPYIRDNLPQLFRIEFRPRYDDASIYPYGAKRQLREMFGSNNYCYDDDELYEKIIDEKESFAQVTKDTNTSHIYESRRTTENNNQNHVVTTPNSGIEIVDLRSLVGVKKNSENTAKTGDGRIAMDGEPIKYPEHDMSQEQTDEQSASTPPEEAVGEVLQFDDEDINLGYPILDDYDKSEFEIEGTVLKKYIGKGEEVIIPHGIARIEENAFSGFSNLTSVTIPESIKSIGTDAFIGCGNLTSVYYMGDIAGWCNIKFDSSSASPFAHTNLSQREKLYINNTLVSNLIIPDGVTSIGDYAFCYYTRLTSVTISNSVKLLGKSIFWGCCNISNITLGNSVIDIGDYAFAECFKIPTLNIPDTVIKIGQYAFQGCQELYSITIPENVLEIGNGAFWDCNLYEICNKSKLKITKDGVIDWRIGNDVLNIITKQEDSKLKITNEGFVFYSDKEYGNILVKYIGDAEDLVLPQNYYSQDYIIGRNAFGWKTNIKTITIPESVKSIGEYAFRGCRNLISITIPESVMDIGEHAFYICNKLGNVTMPKILAKKISLEKVFDDHFKNIKFCLTDSNGIIYDKAEFEIEGTVLKKYNGKGGEVHLPEGITEIKTNAFKNNSNITKVIIPDSVISIGSEAFDGCTNLKNLTIGKGVKYIGLQAFSHCNSLAQVHFMGDILGWCNIYYSDYCANPWGGYCHDLYINDRLLTELVIPDGVTEIKEYAFVGCSSIKSVIIPNSIESIAYNAFDKCDNLIAVTIPDRLAGFFNRNIKLIFYKQYRHINFTLTH